MLAYYVEWHMRQALVPLLHGEEANDFPPTTFQSLLADLATVAINRVRPMGGDLDEFDKVTEPAPLQVQAFDLIGAAHSGGVIQPAGGGSTQRRVDR
jgi:kynureninase